MDREIWTIVMTEIRAAVRHVGQRWYREPLWPDWLVVAMEVWRTAHNQSHSWACDRSNYTGAFRPRKRTADGRSLPSISQFTRRVKSAAAALILQRVHDRLSGRVAGVVPPAPPVRYVDAKPLTVSPVSKDPDAARGHVTGGFAKGYKLHAFVGEDRRIQVWGVMPLNVAEQSVAMAMVPELAPGPAVAGGAGGGLTLADGNYDAAPLHKALAAGPGDRLLTPLKAQQRVKAEGHHPVTLRQMGPQRREAVAVWDDHPALADLVLKQRNNVEGVFSVMTVACALTLPAHVRRLPRVRRWAGCKIILYHARLLVQERAAAA